MFSVQEINGRFLVWIESEELENPFKSRRWGSREEANKAIEDFCKKHQPVSKF
jgi:hypothetical protein